MGCAVRHFALAFSPRTMTHGEQRASWATLYSERRNMAVRGTKQAKPAAPTTGVPTHALSVCQPWAWAIVRGHKTVENRTWATAHRGLIAIHASSSTRHLTGEAECFLIDAGDHVFKDLEDPRFTKANPCFYVGAIIGVVEVIGCVETDEGAVDFEGECRDAGFGAWYDAQRVPPAYWAQGTQCWLLQNAVQFSKPIECKGALNLWKLKPEQQQAIAVELARKPRLLPVEFVELQQRAAAGAKARRGK